MKKILFLLLFTISSYGQAVFDEGIQISNTESTTATKVNVQETDGTINYIYAINLPVSAATQIAIDGKVSDTIRDGINAIAPSENAVYKALQLKENISNKATDFTTVNNTLYPTVQAAKTYADGLVVGLLNDRGSYDASVNLYPSTGGSGSAGAIKKGNLWAISVTGTLGGVSVSKGDWVRALVDTPAQTAANWSVVEGNFGYVPENVANKSNSYTVSSTTDYPSTKALVDGLATKVNNSSFTTTPTAAAFTHYFGETASDGIIRPKTLANVKTEIVTAAAVDAAKPNIATVTSGAANSVPRFNTASNLVPGSISDNGITISSSVDFTVNGVSVGRGGGNIPSNTRVGSSALMFNVAGTNNVAIGLNAGAFSTSLNLTDPNSSIFIGRTTRSLNPSTTNEIVIADQGQGLGSNTTVLGNSSTTYGRWWGRLLLGTSIDNGVDNLQVNGSILATTFKKSGGLATQYLMADGSVTTGGGASNLSLGTATATTQPITNSNGTGFTLPSATTSLAGLLSSADKVKLNGIAVGATANQSDAYLLSRANHTGSQAISTVTGLQTNLDSKINTSEKGANNGLATLDPGGKVPLSQLPAGSDVNKGTWDASTNSPVLVDGTGSAGWYYYVSVAGTQNLGSGSVSYMIGDRVNYNGSIWQRIPNYQSVSSVNGQKGVVSLNTSNILESGNLYYTDSRVSANTSVAANTAKVTNATHTGDVTGSTALTLAIVNSNVGTFGNASNSTTQTVNAKGLTTAISNVPIQIAESQVTGLVSDLAGKEPSFSKNTAFNKDFGITTGTVVEGNDSRMSNTRFPSNDSNLVHKSGDELSISGIKRFTTEISSPIVVADSQLVIGDSDPTIIRKTSTAQRVVYLPDASGTLVLSDSPAFTGTPTAPTAPAGTNTTQIATMEALQTAITAAGVTSGTYTPVYANAINTSSFVAENAYYTRVGDLVTVNIGYRIALSENNTNTTYVFTLTVPFPRNVDTPMMIGSGSIESFSQKLPVLVNTTSSTGVTVYLTAPISNGATRQGHISFTYSIN